MNYHRLRAWHGMSHEEFVAQLRAVAIDTGASAVLINTLDELLDEFLDRPTPDDVEDARYGGGADMRDAAVIALEAALPAHGLTRKQIGQIVAVIERLRPS